MTKDFFRNKLHPLFESIESSSFDILKLPVKNERGFNPFKFVNYSLKLGNHPQAVHEALASLIKCYSGVKNPWAYCNTIANKRSPMCYERQNISKHVKVMDEFKIFVNNSERIKSLTEKIGNIWI
jgi:hypothetical protein